MAKEKEKEEPKSKPKAGGKKQHLHEIRSTQSHDGSIVHHHTYKEHVDHPHTLPERGPMATSASPEEAGQHVSEMFGQNAMAGAQPAGEAGPEAGGPGGPAAGGEEAGAGEPEMA